MHKSENESTMKMDIVYFLENPLGIKKSLGMAKCFALLIELSSLKHLKLIEMTHYFSNLIAKFRRVNLCVGFQ